VNPPLPVVSGADVVNAFVDAGFARLGQRGSHVKLRRADLTVVDCNQEFPRRVTHLPVDVAVGIIRRMDKSSAFTEVDHPLRIRPGVGADLHRSNVVITSSEADRIRPQQPFLTWDVFLIRR